jgi:hypothetical protein
LQELREKALSNIHPFRGLAYWTNMSNYIQNSTDKRILNIIGTVDFNNLNQIIEAWPWETSVVFYPRNHWLYQKLDNLSKMARVNELFRLISEKEAVDKLVIEEKLKFKQVFLESVAEAPSHIQEVFIKSLKIEPTCVSDIYDTVYKWNDSNNLNLKETIKNLTGLGITIPNRNFAIEAIAILLQNKDPISTKDELLLLESTYVLNSTFINKHLFNDKTYSKIDSILNLNFAQSHLILDLSELTYSIDSAIFHIEKIAKESNLPYALFLDKIKKDKGFLEQVSIELLTRRPDVERSTVIKSLLSEFKNVSFFQDELIESGQRIAVFQAKEIIFSILILQSPPSAHAFLKSEIGQSLILLALGVFLKDKGFDSIASEMRVSALSNVGNSILEEFYHSIFKTIVPELSNNLDKIRILEQSSLEENIDSQIKEVVSV